MGGAWAAAGVETITVMTATSAITASRFFIVVLLECVLSGFLIRSQPLLARKHYAAAQENSGCLVFSRFADGERLAINDRCNNHNPISLDLGTAPSTTHGPLLRNDVVLRWRVELYADPGLAVRTAQPRGSDRNGTA